MKKTKAENDSETKKLKEHKPTVKERFDYWFDRHTSKGSLGLIRALIICSLVVAVLIALLIIVLRFNGEEEGAGSVIWNSIATVINAWMPYFDDGGTGYLILMSIVAIVGLLFTSVLIGIITSVIEEKIIELKRGNSRVLEEDHIVVLGFTSGEYTLLRELILAAEGKPACLVLAEDIDREELEQELKENLDVPKNFKLLCRTVDITDPASIEKCSVETCRSVIISPTDDFKTFKAILAVSSYMKEKNVKDVRVNAIVSRNDYRFPASMAETHNISTLQTNNVLAKMIAHSCTQAGLSETFTEIFNFEGSEFYLADVPETENMTYADVIGQLNNAIPAGVFRDGEARLNPPAGFELRSNDKLIVFSDFSDAAEFVAPAGGQSEAALSVNEKAESTETSTQTVIFGENEMLPVILEELPANVDRVYVVGREITEEEQEPLAEIAAARNMSLVCMSADLSSEEELIRFAKMTEHVVILNDHGKDSEEADMEVIFLLLTLRDIRERFKLQFNISVEMRREISEKLVGEGDRTDFLVISNISSLILAQVAENPELRGVFKEILSNTGNELYLKGAGALGITGTHTVRELRQRVLRYGYSYLGHIDNEAGTCFDAVLNETVKLAEGDKVVVIGED